MVYSFVFSNGLNNLNVQQDGGVFDFTKFSGAKIVGRRKFVQYTSPWSFSESAETVDTLLTNVVDLDTGSLFFYGYGGVTILDQSNSVDPEYSPVNLNDVVVTPTTLSSSLPEGLGFKFTISGTTGLNIETTGSPAQLPAGPIDVTFRIPYLRVRDASTGERWMATVEISASVSVTDQVARTGVFTSTSQAFLSTTPNQTFVDVTFQFTGMAYDGVQVEDADPNVYIVSSNPSFPTGSIMSLGGSISNGTGLVTFSVPPFMDIPADGTLKLAYFDGFSGYVENQYTFGAALSLNATITPVPLTTGGYRVFIENLNIAGFNLEDGQALTIVYNDYNSSTEVTYSSGTPYFDIADMSTGSGNPNCILIANEKQQGFRIDGGGIGTSLCLSSNYNSASLVLGVDVDYAINFNSLLSKFNVTSVNIKDSNTDDILATNQSFALGEENTYNLSGLDPEKAYNAVIYTSIDLGGGLSTTLDIASISFSTTSRTFAATIGTVTPVYNSATGGMTVTFSASDISIEGVPVTVGDSNLVLVYPSGAGYLSLPVTLSSDGTIVDSTVALSEMSYADQTVYLAYIVAGTQSGYAPQTFSLGGLSVSVPMSADIIPYPLDDGTFLLAISSVSVDGVSITSGTLSVVPFGGKGTPISITYNASGNLIFGPYSLEAEALYYLQYQTAQLQFNTFETLPGVFEASNISTTGASLVFTPNLQEGFMFVNNADIDGYIDGQSSYNLYSVDGILVDTKTWDGTNPITFSLTGLSPNTSYSYSIKYTKSLTVGDSTYTILSRTSLSTSLLTSMESGGGGGGGGGGNNGGNGYNNMATLELAYDGYSGTVSQTNTITVLGESRAALTADETITVNVPLANFKKVLKYASTWDASLTGDQAGEQPRPRVKFTPTESGAALDALDAMLTSLSAKGSGAAAGRLWADDANVDHQVFGGIMLGSVTFTNSALDDDEVPRESIRKIVEGDLTVPDIDTTVTALDSQGAGATLKGQLESLFEQAANAGRVKTTDDADGSDFKNPSFEAGDSISFLVKYDFTKTRAYEVDDEVVNPATAGRATITVNGQSIQLAGYSEESDAYSKTYEIKMVATA